MIGNCLGYFEKPHSYVKTSLASLGATFGKNWATFYSDIWSHCSRRTYNNAHIGGLSGALVWAGVHHQ